MASTEGNHAARPSRAGHYRDTGTGTLPPGNQMRCESASAIPGTGANTQVGGGALPDWDPSQMKQDRDKLAAYTVHFKFDSAVVQDNEQAQRRQRRPGPHFESGREAVDRRSLRRTRHGGVQSLARERRALACVRRWPRSAWTPCASAPSATARTSRWTPATMKPAWAKNRRGQFVYCTPNGPCNKPITI